MTPLQPPPAFARRAVGERRTRALLALAALALFAALAALGARWHWVEEAGTAERDGYVLEAEELLAGELPHDPFRPLLYPLATAGLAKLTGAPFVAARLLSELAATALALLAFAFARRLAGGAAAGWWAFGAVALDPNLWTIGHHVTTDMTFAALAAGSLLAAFAYLERPGWRPALAGGLALGLAAFTRSNAVFVLPAWLVAWWLAGRVWPAGAEAAEGAEALETAEAAEGAAPAGAPAAALPARRRRLAHLFGLAGMAALVLVPHFALRQAQFGDPLHDENWKNLAYKLYGWPDWSYMQRVPFSGPLEVVAADPWRVVAGTFAELRRFVQFGFWQLVGTQAHALLFLAGAGVTLAVRRRRAGWLLFAGASFVVAVAASFFTWGRLLLVVLPIAAALTWAPWGGAVRRAWLGWLAGSRRTRSGPAPLRWAVARAPRLLALVGAVALGSLAVKTFAYRLPAFAARHPYAEVAALRRLAAQAPPNQVLAGFSPYLDRYLDRPYLYLPDAFGPETREPALYYRTLHGLLRRYDVRYLVAAAVDLRDRPAALLGDRPPVHWLAPAGGDERVRVWRVLY